MLTPGSRHAPDSSSCRRNDSKNPPIDANYFQYYISMSNATKFSFSHTPTGPVCWIFLYLVLRIWKPPFNPQYELLVAISI